MTRVALVYDRNCSATKKAKLFHTVQAPAQTKSPVACSTMMASMTVQATTRAIVSAAVQRVKLTAMTTAKVTIVH